MIRVAIVGASGRMGQTLSHEIAERDEFELTYLVDPLEPLFLASAQWVSEVTGVDATKVDVMLDFSTLSGASVSLQWCLDHDVAIVVGATGFSSVVLNEWSEKFLAGAGHAIIASNFSIGALLAQRFATQAAEHFDSVEIIELHHDKKIDAPSGTSLSAARGIAEARERAGRSEMIDPTQRETLAGGRGAKADGGIRIHSVRLAGLVAHQEVIFGNPGEGLIIRHDSYDRKSFVGGVVVALRAVRNRLGLTLGIDELV